jgi:hypothetical protein
LTEKKRSTVNGVAHITLRSDSGDDDDNDRGGGNRGDDGGGDSPCNVPKLQQGRTRRLPSSNAPSKIAGQPDIIKRLVCSDAPS